MGVEQKHTGVPSDKGKQMKHKFVCEKCGAEYSDKFDCVMHEEKCASSALWEKDNPPKYKVGDYISKSYGIWHEVS